MTICQSLVLIKGLNKIWCLVVIAICNICMSSRSLPCCMSYLFVFVMHMHSPALLCWSLKNNKETGHLQKLRITTATWYALENVRSHNQWKEPRSRNKIKKQKFVNIKRRRNLDRKRVIYKTILCTSIDKLNFWIEILWYNIKI
jgi:hypothetical protein